MRKTMAKNIMYIVLCTIDTIHMIHFYQPTVNLISECECVCHNVKYIYKQPLMACDQAKRVKTVQIIHRPNTNKRTHMFTNRYK